MKKMQVQNQRGCCDVYNKKKDRVDGFVDFGYGKRTKYIANYAAVVMARGIFENGNSPLGIFLQVAQ